MNTSAQAAQQQLKVAPRLDACGTLCRGYNIPWKIEPPQQNGIDYVSVIQKLTLSAARTPCRLEHDPCNPLGKCVPLNPCREGPVEIYEFLGTITFQRNDGLLLTDILARFEHTVDRWEGPNVFPLCIERGTKTMRGEIRGFPDNNLAIRRSISENDDWISPGLYHAKCIGGQQVLSDLYGLGWHRLDPPKQWPNKHMSGFSRMTNVYDCCLGATNVAFIESTSDIGEFLRECS
jgi:hypothetical protein